MFTKVAGDSKKDYKLALLGILLEIDVNDDKYWRNQENTVKIHDLVEFSRLLLVYTGLNGFIL